MRLLCVGDVVGRRERPSQHGERAGSVGELRDRHAQVGGDAGGALGEPGTGGARGRSVLGAHAATTVTVAWEHARSWRSSTCTSAASRPPPAPPTGRATARNGPSTPGRR